MTKLLVDGDFVRKQTQIRLIKPGAEQIVDRILQCVGIVKNAHHLPNLTVIFIGRHGFLSTLWSTSYRRFHRQAHLLTRGADRDNQVVWILEISETAQPKLLFAPDQITVHPLRSVGRLATGCLSGQILICLWEPFLKIAALGC